MCFINVFWAGFSVWQFYEGQNEETRVIELCLCALAILHTTSRMLSAKSLLAIIFF